MPPRQKTTFKKGQKKGTTTYRDYNPAQERANAQLERFIRDNPEGDRRNTEASPIRDVVLDMPKKFQDDFEGITKYEDMNQAQKALFGFYNNRNKYARDMNNLRTSSPEMRQAYAKRFPIANFMMEVAPRFIPGIGALFTADKGMKANAEKERILNTPINRPEGGFKNFVEFFKPKMNSEQIANTEIIESEQKPLITPQDMNIQKAVNPSFVSPQDMGFLDSENIFDTEKAAIDAALTPGDVFDPVAADKQSKVDFINQVENTNMTVDRVEQVAASNGMTLNDVFEKSKQKQGMIIRDEVDINQQEDVEDPIPGGQFNLTSPTVDENTVPLILGGAGPDYDYTNFNINQQLGDVLPTDDILAQGNEKRSFVDDNYGKENPNIFLNDQRFDIGSGTEMVGDSMFATEPGSQSAFDTLNSNATSGFTGQPKLRYNFADGGSTNKYENMSTHEKLMRMASEMYG